VICRVLAPKMQKFFLDGVANSGTGGRGSIQVDPRGEVGPVCAGARARSPPGNGQGGGGLDGPASGRPRPHARRYGHRVGHFLAAFSLAQALKPAFSQSRRMLHPLSLRGTAKVLEVAPNTVRTDLKVCGDLVRTEELHTPRKVTRAQGARLPRRYLMWPCSRARPGGGIE